jgi:hypothetical protein
VGKDAEVRSHESLPSISTLQIIFEQEFILHQLHAALEM